MTIIKVTMENGESTVYETSTMEINKFSGAEGDISFSLNIIDKEVSVPLTYEVKLVQVDPKEAQIPGPAGAGS